VYDTISLQSSSYSIPNQTVVVFTYLRPGGLGTGQWFRQRMVDTDYSIANIPLVAKVQKTTLTLSQVQNLNTTPVTILTQTSGYARIATSIYIKRSSADAYTLANQNFDIVSNNGAWALNLPCAILAAGGAVYLLKNIAHETNGTGVNEGDLKLKALTGNPSGGAGGFDVYLTYNEFFIGY